MVDAGDTGWKNLSLTSGRKAQQREKFELQLAAFALAGIDAWTPGEGDLALGPDAVFAATGAAGTPVVATNLHCEGVDLPASRVVSRGGVTLGFVSALDPSLLGDGVGGCTASDPRAALQAALADLPDDLDAVVLLSHQDVAADAPLAEALPDLDIVVNGHGRKTLTGAGNLTPTAVQLASGSRGKSLGVAKVHFVEGAQGFSGGSVGTEELERKLVRYRDRLAQAETLLAGTGVDAPDKATRSRAERQKAFYGEQITILEARKQAAAQLEAVPAHRVEVELVSLGAEVSDHPATADLVAAALGTMSEETPDVPSVRPQDLAYVGSNVCQGCHTAEHAQWEQTAHAKAWRTLEQEQRQLDLDCWSCHATGAELPGGPTHPQHVTPALQGVGCESCHGPGRDHVAAAAAAAAHGADPDMPVSAGIVKDPPQATCTHCHDGVQDEGRFDFDQYRPKVVHGG